MSGDAATREQSTIPEMVVGRSEKSVLRSFAGFLICIMSLVMTELHVSSFSDYIYDSNILIMGQGIASIFQGMYFTRYLAMNVEITSSP